MALGRRRIRPGAGPRKIPFGYAFIRVADGVDLNDSRGAAEGRVVFALHPASTTPAAAAGRG